MNDFADSFLRQFEATKASVERWPRWMQESAHVATVAFPRTSPTAGEKKSKAGDSARVETRADQGDVA